MITDKVSWEKWVKGNQDEYGKYCVDVARRVMELLDEDSTPLHEGYNPDIHTPHGLISKADEDINAGGITGFMAGCIAKMVSKCHSRGEEFRLIWNAPYKVKVDNGGVVNPAILTIGDEDAMP